MTEFKPQPGEVATELEHVDRSPYGCSRKCAICEHHDNLHCARGADCLAGDGENGANIGEWVGEDPDTCHPMTKAAYVFAFESLPGAYFCEDCAIALELGNA